ncbi:MAG: P1 family peptidase [Gemmatimonadaceae bacterium]
MLRTSLFICVLLGVASSPAHSQDRPRARDLGIRVGIFQPGANNAITDVPGVLVGSLTLRDGDSIATGLTAILPHAGNVYRSRVPAAVHVLNGFGKMLGIAQVQELGELESPILLTCTLCVWRAADGLVEHLLAQPGMESVRSINPVVAETNDGRLNDIRSRPIRPEHVRSVITGARGGAVEEGSVGAGTGTVAFGWKGGIGTSSRRIPTVLGIGDYTVGALVQSNFGGILTINGAPVGRELGRYSFADRLERGSGDADGRGSIIIVIATDAPLDAFTLQSLAQRAALGLARTGSFSSFGSGDFIIAFSTAESVRRSNAVPTDGREPSPLATTAQLRQDRMSPLYEAVVEATEEAIYNSLFRATTVRYRGTTVEPLPIDRTMEILRRYNALGSREANSQ